MLAQTDRFLSAELQKINLELKKHLIEKGPAPLTFGFNEIDLAELINHITCEKIFFFKSKYDNFVFLGLGHSQTIKAQDLDSYLIKHPEHFLIAAFMFETDPNLSEFILPEWVFVSRNGKTELNIYPSFDYQNFSSPSLFFNLNFDLFLYDPDLFPWKSYEEHPEHDQWALMINRCDQYFKTSDLTKVVLSRKKIFEYDEPVSPAVFFKSLLLKNDNANTSYAIFYQMTFDHAFISLTPEKLFSIDGDNFESISLAASAPRGITDEEDAEFESLLNTNDKLAREHNIVTEEILKNMTPLSQSINASKLQTMKLPYIQHRAVPINAKLLPNTTALKLINVLHPTPAVGGLPRDLAQQTIKELEPYARESYAAPIGIISAHYSELAVGIRSATITGTKVTLFGGAGIVSGSLAEEEWVETGIKMNPFLKVVNHE
jgi:menaquinone-specific isochorismate synthase